LYFLSESIEFCNFFLFSKKEKTKKFFFFRICFY
jgi:hypothetical protein